MRAYKRLQCVHTHGIDTPVGSTNNIPHKPINDAQIVGFFYVYKKVENLYISVKRVWKTRLFIHVNRKDKQWLLH